jgi:fibronectin-binding autotransporter adhesin
MKVKLSTAAIVILLSGFNLGARVQAQNVVDWVGGSGVDWSHSANWSGGVVPNNAGGTTYNVTIAPTSPINVNLNQSVTVTDLTLGSTAGLIGTLVNPSGDPLTIANGQLTINPSSTIFWQGGNLAITGAGTLTNNGTLSVQQPGAGLNVFGATTNAAGAMLKVLAASFATLTGNVTNSGLIATGWPASTGGNNVTLATALTNSAGGVVEIGGNFSAPGDVLSVNGITNNATGATISIAGGSTATFASNMNNSGTFGTGFPIGIGNDTVNLRGVTNATGANFSLSYPGDIATVKQVFSNAGTVTVAAGTSLNCNKIFVQSAGTTTVDGTLAGNIAVLGGTLLGAGTLQSNVILGGSGIAPILNVGDASTSGLLLVTGKYQQLSTGTLNVSIGGTTVGTQYSQLRVSDQASLGGTLTAELVDGFTPSLGETFTILTASHIFGAFTNSTIAINSSEHFAVSYTSTTVVLTVVTGPAHNGSSATTPSWLSSD